MLFRWIIILIVGFFLFRFFTTVPLVTETAEKKSAPGNSGRDGPGPGL